MGNDRGVVRVMTQNMDEGSDFQSARSMSPAALKLRH